jgi:hypothetical protein
MPASEADSPGRARGCSARPRLGGTLELWCIGAQGDRLSFQSSGMTLDLESGFLRGRYVQCP